MTFSTVIADIREEGRSEGRQHWQVLLEEAGFAPGDKGTLEAVARSGAKLSIPVLGVVKDGGEIWIRVQKPLMTGTKVTARVERAKADAQD
ncbi:MAG TPA: hypothetical protein VFS41_04510 [Edaphobacter sp.]|nr:hypothetical protein [Edaphobacter sp.]